MRLIRHFATSILFFYSLTTFAADNTQWLHLDWIDKTIKPGQNFFAYANGNWQKQNPIPAAYPSWGVMETLKEQNQIRIKDLIQTATKKNNKPGSIEQKVGDFYFSGMDEASIDKLGITPLQPELDRINSIKTIHDLQTVITHLQMIGTNALFDFGQMQDFNDSTKVIGVASQDGLGLPDKDYYLKEDKKFKKIREAYVAHITKVFTLLGENQQQANAEAKTVMSIETALAKASMSRADQRDPHAVYHIMSLSQLDAITPNFSWSQYFNDIGHPEIKQINLAMPDFFKFMNAELKNISLDSWKTYLRFHLADNFSPFLSKPFVNEKFHMTSILTGTKELLPRWKRVVDAENGALGFAIGKLYVEKYFPASSKETVLTMLKNIRSALRNDLETLSWMSPETRKAAITKLDLMGERVGYPDVWRDYSNLKIDRGPYVLNIMRSSEFLTKRDLNKIGKPVDKTEWDMVPQEVNAYYDPSTNRLNIPAGILQPPLFDPKAPTAVNYGAIGFVMGHEMTHGFDDQGAQFDGYGNLNNWWSKADLKRFNNITQQIVKQFSNYTVDGNIHIQGKLVVGEATADLGGVTLAYRAFHASDLFAQAKTLAGFTPDQQFFLGAAHVWAKNIRPELARNLALIDPHPPAIYRVNGTFANMAQFQEAYKLTATDSLMVNKEKYVIW